MQQRSNNSATGRGRLNAFRFFGEVVGELKRVTWPTMPETFRLTLMVLAVAAFIGVILGIADFFYGKLFDIIL
jgi:preprotein translocase subunit SecE